MISAYEQKRLDQIEQNEQQLHALGLLEAAEDLRDRSKTAPATMPSALEYAISLKGAQLAWALAHGLKPIENRHVRLPLGWIGLHVSANTIDPEQSALCSRAGAPAESSLRKSVLVGAIRVDGACYVEDCSGTAGAEWAHGPICNIVGACCMLSDPVPHAGALGAWRISPDALALMRTRLATASVTFLDPSTLPRATLPALPARLPRRDAASSSSGERASSRLAGQPQPSYIEEDAAETERGPSRKRPRVALVPHELGPCSVLDGRPLLGVRLFALEADAEFAGRCTSADGMRLEVSTRRGSAASTELVTSTIALERPLVDADVRSKDFADGVWTLRFELAKLGPTGWL